MTAERPPLHLNVHKLARMALFGFILTFVAARVCVLLIMSRTFPNFYFFLKGTHVHHLNYGIFLLAAVAGYAVFRRPVGRAAEATALLYGIAMALTFDEFGMWLHLGGSYWQRASVDAVILVAADEDLSGRPVCGRGGREDLGVRSWPALWRRDFRGDPPLRGQCVPARRAPGALWYSAKAILLDLPDLTRAEMAEAVCETAG
jgi:hypothetical protein